MTLFSEVPIRINGLPPVDASWWNLLRAAGLSVGAWKKYTVTHTQLQTAGLTNNIELLSLAAFERIGGVWLKHSTAFAGAGITAYGLTVGIASTLDKFAGSFDVLQATGDTVSETNSLTDVESIAGATSIKIAATSVGANLDQSSAGSVDIWVWVSAMPIL